MNACIQTSNRENPICGVCQGGFGVGEERWTCGSENRNGHDPYHKDCLQRWVNVNPTCPSDRSAINPNSIFSRAERIFGVAKEAAVNSAIAAGVMGGGFALLTTMEQVFPVVQEVKARAAGMGKKAEEAVVTLFGMGVIVLLRRIGVQRVIEDPFQALAEYRGRKNAMIIAGGILAGVVAALAAVESPIRGAVDLAPLAFRGALVGGLVSGCVTLVLR